MGQSNEQIALSVTATKNTGALPEAAAEVRSVGTAAAETAQQVNAAAASQGATIGKAAQAAQQFGSAYQQALAQARAAIAQTASATAAAGAAEREGYGETLSLLGLKVRAVDVANEREVAGVQEAIAAQRAYMESLGATESEYTKLDLILAALERRVRALATAQEGSDRAAARMSQTMNGVGSQRLMRSAMAINTIAFAAEGATTSSAGLARALGNVALTAGLIGSGGSMALFATGVGAAIIVVTGLVEWLKKANEEAKASVQFTQQLSLARFTDLHGALDVGEIDRYEAGLRRVTEEQQAAAAQFRDGDYILPWTNAHKAMMRYETSLANLEAFEQKRRDLLIEEDKRVKNLAESRRLETLEEERGQRLTIAKLGYEAHAQELAAGMTNAIDQRSAALAAEGLQQAAEIRRSFERRDEYGRLIPLNDALLSQQAKELSLAQQIAEAKRVQLANEVALANAKLASSVDGARGTAQGDYAARLAAIQQQAADDLQSHENTETNRRAISERTELQIRALRYATFQGAIQHAGEFTKVLTDSGSRQVRAVGHAAESIRRILIGADGAHSAVLALKEGAAALGSFALGDFGGGALHLASSAQYAAAAAKAGQESLGGGGGSGGGGGGGGGGAGTQTFEPTARDGNGNLTLNLITRDPYGRDAMSTTIYELNRSQVLKRPIPTYPTSGVALAGG